MATAPSSPVATALDTLEAKIKKLWEDEKISDLELRLLGALVDQYRDDYEVFDANFEALKRHLDAWETELSNSRKTDTILTCFMSTATSQSDTGGLTPATTATLATPVDIAVTPSISGPLITSRDSDSVPSAIKACTALLANLPFVKRATLEQTNQVAANTPTDSHIDGAMLPVSRSPKIVLVSGANGNDDALATTVAPITAQNKILVFVKEVAANPFGVNIGSRLLKTLALHAAVDYFVLTPAGACDHTRAMSMLAIFFSFIIFKFHKLKDKMEDMSTGVDKTKMEADIFVLTVLVFRDDWAWDCCLSSGLLA